MRVIRMVLRNIRMSGAVARHPILHVHPAGISCCVGINIGFKFSFSAYSLFFISVFIE